MMLFWRGARNPDPGALCFFGCAWGLKGGPVMLFWRGACNPDPGALCFLAARGGRKGALRCLCLD